MMISAPETLPAAPLFRRNLWQQAISALRSDRAHVKILSGSMIMLLGSVLISGVNFAYNMVTARLLGPTDFGHASVVITLLMLTSAVTLAFQLVCAKFVARNESLEGKRAVVGDLHKQAWLVSSAVALGLVFYSGALTRYLNLPARSILLLLALGIWFYIPLGVRRGAMQGQCAFPWLTFNFLLEAGVKFAGAVAFIELLLHARAASPVLGAILALALSVIVAYFLPALTPELRSHHARPAQGACIPASMQEGMQAIVFFIGQVLINNIDIVLVKHFFAPREAGLYAAVALVGRVLYFAAWSVVSAMFPVTASVQKQDESLSIVAIPMGAVLAISAGFVVITALIPHFIMHMVFGAAFNTPLENLLSWYAAATGLYALSVVLMAYEISRKIANTAWLQLAFSGLIITGICLFHANLRQVVMVQLVLMLLMLIAVSLPFLRLRARADEQFLKRGEA